MAQTYSRESVGMDNVPVDLVSSAEGYGARLKRFRATIDFKGQAVGDTIVLADLPVGYIFAYAVVTTSKNISTATLAIGTVEIPTLYSPAESYTVVDQPQLVGVSNAIADTALTQTHRIIATVGELALPTDGFIVIDLFASMPN